MAETENQAEAVEDKITILKELVIGLYEYKDHYFETHPIEDAYKKNEEIKERLDKVIQQFDQLKVTCEKEQRKEYLFLRGRVLDILPQYNSESEELLSKAVKLDPSLIEAWNELGECYWKKGDVESAERCFHRALEQEENKVSLRNLSIVLRQRSFKTAEERKRNIEEGLKRARAALHKDTSDGLSWIIFGNANLAYYFTVAQDPAALKKSINAYRQAEKDIVARNTPDLHYNRAGALKYEEEYIGALNSFSQACALDPTWDLPKECQGKLLKYLSSIQELVLKKGKLNARKIRTLLNKLSESHLGPYRGGSFTQNDKTVCLKFTSLKDLETGPNLEKVVMGKVVCSVCPEEYTPFTLCLLGSDDHCVVVTIYNLKKGTGPIIGDTVAIPEPFLTKVDFQFQQQTFLFDSIRVEIPSVMVVNGKKVSKSLYVPIEVSTFSLDK